MSPPDGKQPAPSGLQVCHGSATRISSNCPYTERKCSFRVPWREDHGASEKWLLFGLYCLGFVAWASSETEIWVFTFRIWTGTNFPASITPCHPQVRLSLLGEMSPSGYTGHRKSKAQECGPEDPGLAIFSCKWIPFLKHFARSIKLNPLPCNCKI